MKFYVLIGTLFSFFSLLAQENLSVTFEDKTDESILILLEEKQAIKDDNILNEELVDIVEPYTIDSTYKRKTERHQLIGGAFIRVLGFRWRTIDYTRKKLVGTIIRSSIPGSEKAHFTEYDVNYNLVPHLDKYLALCYDGYMAQTEMFKSRTKKKEGQEPYIPPSEETNPESYQIHCECTPHEDYRLALNTTFYPVMRPMTLAAHPNFQEPHPTVGMYGAWVLDCNHTCHPEIHPYEWLWWYDLTDVETTDQTWHIGFLRDNSNRFKHWSSSPRTGVISVPFAFPIESTDWEIAIEHQLFNGFDEEKISELDLPSNFKHFDQSEWNYALNGTYQSIKVTSNQNITSTGIGYWIDGVNFDAENEVVSGTFHFAMANDDVYTAEMRTSYETPEEDKLAKLSQWMQGSYTSGAQAEVDTNYYDISLHMYPIWEHLDETWLYVEQALTARQENPYRQRIYKLSKAKNGQWTSDIYLLPDNETAVGQWQNPIFFNQWTPNDLTIKDGCTVFLTEKAGKFVGGTIEDNCPSTLYGASYTTTEVEIFEDKIMSWDRGFDADGNHIWGAEKAGYIFIKE